MPCSVTEILSSAYMTDFLILFFYKLHFLKTCNGKSVVRKQKTTTKTYSSIYSPKATTVQTVYENIFSC